MLNDPLPPFEEQQHRKKNNSSCFEKLGRHYQRHIMCILFANWCNLVIRHMLSFRGSRNKNPKDYR